MAKPGHGHQGKSVRLASLAAMASLVGSVFVAGCEREGQIRSRAPEENVIVVDDTSGAIRDREPAIRSVLTSTLARVSKVLPVSGVTITVIPDPRRAIPDYGVGGYTPGAYSVKIYVDPSFRDSAVLPDRLTYTLAHELHHAVRWRGPGYGRTLLEAMITEGLADRFAIEILGVPAPPWSDAFPRDQTAHFLDLARAEFASPTHDHARWFFGSEASPPRWAGYTLGFRLVEAYEERHPGATAAKLVDTPAGVFLPDRAQPRGE